MDREPIFRRAGVTLFLAALAALAGGCTALSGAASMRVEVDVYKGPLSRDYFMQAGELAGLVQEFGQSLTNFREGVRRVAWRQGACVGPDCSNWICDGKKDKQDDTGKAALSLKETLECSILKQIHDGAKTLKAEAEQALDGLESNQHLIDVMTDSKKRRRLLCAVGRLGVRAKARALYWAESLVPTGGTSRQVRASVIAFANLLAEYGNQVGANADALAKRALVYDMMTNPKDSDDGSKNSPGTNEGCEGECTAGSGVMTNEEAGLKSANRLSTSVFLRDTEPTDFVNLFTWNRAGTPEPWENRILHPIESFSSESTANRVRAVERVFSDQYWARINTVYASGQGDVNMAFVRDDLGNWNLRSFGSDPGGLLKAYQQLFEATTLSVIRSIKNHVTPSGALMEQLGAMAGGALVAGKKEPVSPATVDQLDKLMLERLAVLKRQADRIESSDMEKAERDSQRQALIEEVRRVLRRHKAVLERLQDGQEGAVRGKGAGALLENTAAAVPVSN